MQGKKITGRVNTNNTLQAVMNLCDTVNATVSAEKTLNASLTTQQKLQASLSSGKTIGGKVNKVAYVVDSELSYESTNPVQNKVITKALDKKIDSLNIAKNTDIDKLFS